MMHALQPRLSYVDARTTLLGALRSNLVARDRYARWKLPGMQAHVRALVRNNINLIRALDKANEEANAPTS